ncbi:MAG: YfhO family protein [Rhodospirillales bacterium]|nr:YfhO family protein [Rhodospirillales bacterium]
MSIDGEPATLLRANYLMRGVHLPPGEHTIEWRFKPPTGGLYVSVAAILVGLLLIGIVVMQSRREPATPAKK